MPLALARMMWGEARFRMVLTMAQPPNGVLEPARTATGLSRTEAGARPVKTQLGVLLDRIGAGPQLCELGREVATLYQLGVTLSHLEGRLLVFSPKADVDLVLTHAQVMHDQVR